MTKKCWDLDLVAVWDSEQRKVLLGCKKTTSRPPKLMDCSDAEPVKGVDLEQLLAELKAAAEEESS